METKPASSSDIEFRINQLHVRQATKDEDKLGADAFLNDLGVGHRKRSYKIDDFSEISIRKLDYGRSEYEKIIDGDSLADIHIQEFDDGYIICAKPDIKLALVAGKGYYQPNGDGTGAYYIHISQILHLRVDKDKNGK